MFVLEITVTVHSIEMKTILHCHLANVADSKLIKYSSLRSTNVNDKTSCLQYFEERAPGVT